MEQTQTFVILSLDELMQKHISYLKKSCREILGHPYESEHSIAHISLAMYTDPHIDNQLYRVHHQISAVRPFNLYIKGYDVLYHGNNKSICLNIDNKNPVRELAEILTGKDIRPHITIAKNLSQSDFDKIWGAINHITYSNHFRCDHLTVLKRNSGPWRHYMDIPFYN